MNLLKKTLRPLYHRVISALHRGHNMTCNCCGSSFNYMRPLSDGHKGVCWLCGSYPRNRAIKIVLEKLLDAEPKPIRMLHIAPEESLRDWLRKHDKIDYVAGDKRMEGYEYPPYVVDLDIRAIPFPDDSFDFILCSHVLEHIIDDRKAMSELRRVLKPTGRAIIQVPIDTDLQISDEEKEGENLTPGQREARFGQFDHVRIYGRDFFDRMKESGLPVDLIEMSAEDCETYSLYDWEDVMTVNFPENLLR